MTTSKSGSRRAGNSQKEQAEADAPKEAPKQEEVRADAHPQTQVDLKPQEPVAGTPGAPAPPASGTAAQDASQMAPGSEVSGSGAPAATARRGEKYPKGYGPQGKEPVLEPADERPIGSAQRPVAESGG